MPTHKNKICFATGEFFPTVGGLSKSATRSFPRFLFINGLCVLSWNEQKESTIGL